MRIPVPSRPDLPPPNPSRLLAASLAGPRGRLLRRAQIGLRRSVLEIGCGHGIVTAELVRRAAGRVLCLDREIGPAAAAGIEGAGLIAGEASRLPFADGAFDLVFCQNVLLWVADLETAIREIARVLQPGGALVALEPDFGGMIEHPPQIALRDLWLKSLRAAGADPEVGRRLPGLCESAGLQTWVELQGIPQRATPQSAQLLLGLPLSTDEMARAETAARAIQEYNGRWSAFVHVPYFLIIATRPPS